MLKHLSIKNIALIENVEIEFENGLNIMTGETGAGKSIIIDSIMAILGNRTRREIIRTGEETALVEALFEFDNEEYLLTRELTTNNKSTCRINGKIVTAQMLKEFGENLIDIHGQHDSQSLLYSENHIKLLDSFGGKEIKDLKAIYTEKLRKQTVCKHELKKLSGNESERQKKLDFLQFEINEIENENLSQENEDALIKEKNLLLNSEKIILSLSNSYDILSDDESDRFSIIKGLNSCLKEILNISNFDNKYYELSKDIESIIFDLNDMVDTIRNDRESIEYSPERFELISDELNKISKLKKKYGATIEEILNYKETKKQELEIHIKNEKAAKELDAEIRKMEVELIEVCGIINSLRKNAANTLESKISNELYDLSMKNTKFKVNIDYTFDSENGKQAFLEDGLDKVEFLISTNPGEPLKPLAKIASGGEMSRIMLAIKTILARVDKIHTLIFDEIDIGISGGIADKVGEKLSNLSKDHQVICVTHLAQIASKADVNFLIEKSAENNITKTNVKKLVDDGIINEIARILAGKDITKLSKEHAKEMLGYKENENG